MSNNILRLPQVKSKTGLPTSGIYKRISEGEFPKQINLGGRSVGWLESEIEYTKFHIESFLLRCKEDGGMSISDLQGLAWCGSGKLVPDQRDLHHAAGPREELTRTSSAPTSSFFEFNSIFNC